MTAIALFKRVDRPFHLVMFDPRAKIDIGEGISHPASTVLTSRVRYLSFDPELPDDFRRWLETDDIRPIGQGFG
ncbi:hypothetical protein ACCS92_38510, partial [Rhizobium ruizarguesonis]